MKGSDGRSGFRAGRTRRAWLAVVTALMLAFSLMVTATPAGAGDRPEKVTICHAAGLADTTHYITLTISENAVYGRHGNAGHFEENGTPRAGHEQDYFGECIPELSSASLTVVKQVDSSEDDVPSSRFPFAMAADGETESFALADGGSMTFDFEFDSDEFDVTVGELTGELAEGFSFVSASCVVGDKMTEHGSRASVSLLDGDEATCTFVNRYDKGGEEDAPSVTVIKDVRGDEGAKTESFEIVVGTRDRNVTMTFEDEGSHTFLPLAGTENFGIAEQAIDEDGWTTAISCVSDEREPFAVRGPSLMIDEIGEGEDIVCTVINTFDDGDTPDRRRSTTTTAAAIEPPCFDGTALNEEGECVEPEQPDVEVLGVQIEATTTTVEAVTVDTLPFTGGESNHVVAASLLVLIAGAVLLGGTLLESSWVRGGRHEASRTFTGWDNR